MKRNTFFITVALAIGFNVLNAGEADFLAALKAELKG